jgi:hypothetical protein
MTIPSIKYKCPKCGKEELSITDSSKLIPVCYCTFNSRNGTNATRMKRVKVEKEFDK